MILKTAIEPYRQVFGRVEYELFKNHPETTAVYYDELPKTVELQYALQNGLIHVEFDYDRTGWSNTGFVYRVKGKDA